MSYVTFTSKLPYSIIIWGSVKVKLSNLLNGFSLYWGQTMGYKFLFFFSLSLV